MILAEDRICPPAGGQQGGIEEMVRPKNHTTLQLFNYTLYILCFNPNSKYFLSHVVFSAVNTASTSSHFTQ